MKRAVDSVYVNVYTTHFLIQNGLQQTGASSPLLLKFALEYAYRKVQENTRVARVLVGHIIFSSVLLTIM
jgi:hypothetical protein